MHVAAYYIEHVAHIGSVATVLTVAVPVAVYVLAVYALHDFLVRQVDAVHWLLLAGTAVLVVVPVLLAAAGVSMAVCLVADVRAGRLGRRLRDGRAPAPGGRDGARPVVGERVVSRLDGRPTTARRSASAGRAGPAGSFQFGRGKWHVVPRDALQVVLVLGLGLPERTHRCHLGDGLARPQPRRVDVGDGVLGDLVWSSST